MRNCYLSRNYKGVDGAGNKAKTDIERIMEEDGFVNIGLPQTRYTHTVLAFLVTLAGVLKAPFCLRKGDRLVLQYPLKKYFTFVCRMAHLRGAKVVVVIHDLGSFRRKKLTVEQEIRRLDHADYIIAHNEKMKRWLEEKRLQASDRCAWHIRLLVGYGSLSSWEAGQALRSALCRSVEPAEKYVSV